MVNAQFLTSKSFGDTTTNFWMKMTETSDGGFIAFGYMNYNAYPQKRNGVLVKFNNSGDTVWSRLFVDTVNTQYLIQLHAAVETPDSAAFLLFGNYDSMAVVVKMDTFGHIMFIKKYRSTSGSIINFEHASVIGDSIFITGRESFAPTYPVLLIKSDIDGNIAWAKQDTNFVYGIYQQITDGESIYLAGYAPASNGFENPQVKKVDLQGNIVWSTIYLLANGNHMTWWGNMDIASDGNLLMTFMDGDYWTSWIYPWIAKTDTSGNPIWMESFVWENGHASTYALEDGRLLMLHTPNYHPLSKITFLDASGIPQVTYADTSSFLSPRAYLKLNSSGRKILFTDPFFLIDSISGPACRWFLNSTITANSGMISHSHPTGQSFPVILSADTGSIVIQSGITMQIICPVVTNFNESYDEESFSFMPNPASESLSIHTRNKVGAQVEVFSISGIRLRTQKIVGDYTILDISDMPQGMYFLKFISGNMTAVKKLIVQ